MLVQKIITATTTIYSFLSVNFPCNNICYFRSYNLVFHLLETSTEALMPSAYRSVNTEHVQYVCQHTFTGVLTHLRQLLLHKHGDWRVRLNMYDSLHVCAFEKKSLVVYRSLQQDHFKTSLYVCSDLTWPHVTFGGTELQLHLNCGWTWWCHYNVLLLNHSMFKQMRMLRRIKGVTLRDRIKSVDIRKELGVSSIQEKGDYAGMDTCREWKKTKWE